MSEATSRRVLLVDLGASMGGVEVYLEALARVLSADTELFALCVLDELASRLRAQGVRVTLLPAFRRCRPLRFAAALVVTTFLLLRYRIHTIQLNGLLESVLLFPASLLRRKSVYTRHGPFELDLYSWYRQPHKFVPRFLARHMAHLASRLVCVSETVGHGCAPHFSAAQLAVIPNWVSHLPASRPVVSSGRAVRVLCVSRLEEYKGVQLLLEAVRDLPVEVAIVGDGSHRLELERRAPSNVVFHGFQRDSSPFYRAADVFVMPSLGPEGLPMVALEAMSHSLACVFSDLPAHAEISENGSAALLFPRGDAAQLRAALLRLLHEPGLQEQHASRARALVARKYHEAAARAAYVQLFRELGTTPMRQSALS